MTTLTPRPVLLVGDPRLRSIAESVSDCLDPAFRSEVEELHTRLNLFRKTNGFGRAISAPQIGIQKRLIALNLGGIGSTLINPVIRWRSNGTFTMWDDCMSFPSLMVKVRRHCSISVEALDEHGKKIQLKQCPQDISELLQHEIDHLDGILALDRAIDKHSIVDRTVFEAMPEYFAAQVDYVIRTRDDRLNSSTT